MDFSYFPNLNARITAWGGIKQTIFNKKRFEASKQTWNMLSPQEIAALDQQLPYGIDTFSCVATPTAIVFYEAHTVSVIPVRDILWIYGDILKQSVNFIPSTKIHTLHLLARNGNTYTLGQFATDGFSKKTPLDDAIREIRELLYPYRKGIVYGYTDEIRNYFHNNFVQAVQIVDANSMTQ